MMRQAPIRSKFQRGAAAWLLAGLLGAAVAAPCFGQPGGNGPEQVRTPDSASWVSLDHAVAVVNRHVILASDLEDEIRVSVLEPNSGGGELTEQQALDRLISRTLIEQQIRQQDMPAIAPAADVVKARLHELRTELPVCMRQNCASDAGWKAFLAARGLTADRVEAYLRYRLEILSFIEERFRQGIQISQQQIETYYSGTLLPQYAPGEAVPSLHEVAPRIQEILLEQQVNDLFDSWLANLRQQGDVEVLDPNLASRPVTEAGPQPAAEALPAPASAAGPGPAQGGGR